MADDPVATTAQMAESVPDGWDAVSAATSLLSRHQVGVRT